MDDIQPQRVALYIRTSTRDQNQEMQERSLREWVSRKPGWRIVHEFRDQESGGTTQRKAYQEMLSIASSKKKKPFDVIAFWSLDRFGRAGVVSTLTDLHRISRGGVRYISKEEESYIDSTNENDFAEPLIAFMAKVAELERKRIRSRIKEGLANRKAKGLPIGRARIVFDREKALRLREDGMSFRNIAASLKVAKSTVERAIQEALKQRC